jgi:hypothetical protein
MAVSTFVINNAELAFVRQLVGKAAASSVILDVVVSESRSIHAKDWTPARYALRVEDAGFTIDFHRPTNAQHLRVDIFHAGLDQFEAFTNKVLPADEASIRADLRGKSITFLGCARQCAAAIPTSIAKIASLGALFGIYQLVVFENDSTDDTASTIQHLAAQHPIELIQRPGLKDQLPERTARLAFGRNQLLARALALGSDYVCWADLDGVLTMDYPSEASFLSSFGLAECWDAVFPVNAGMYYDVWALRHPVLCPNDYMTLGTVLDASLGRKLAVHFAASYVQIDLRELKAWLPVDSAFGGMGIYKTAAIAESRYIGMSEGREVCEHVPFHQDMRSQGRRLFINPQFIIASHGN